MTESNHEAVMRGDGFYQPCAELGTADLERLRLEVCHIIPDLSQW